MPNYSYDLQYFLVEMVFISSLRLPSDGVSLLVLAAKMLR